MNKASIHLFSKVKEKRFSESIASMQIKASSHYQKEKMQGCEDYFAINRALSSVLEQSIYHIDLRTSFDRRMLYELETTNKRHLEGFVQNEKKMLAYRIGDEILKSNLLEFEEWQSHYENVLSVNVGIFKWEEK